MNDIRELNDHNWVELIGIERENSLIQHDPDILRIQTNDKIFFKNVQTPENVQARLEEWTNNMFQPWLKDHVKVEVLEISQNEPVRFSLCCWITSSWSFPTSVLKKLKTTSKMQQKWGISVKIR